MSSIMDKATKEAAVIGKEVTGAATSAREIVAEVVGTTPSEEIPEAEKNEIAIIQGLLHNRTVWSGNLGKDLWFYVRQRHTLLSVGTAHSKHPYSRGDRALVFCSNLCASLGLVLICVNLDGTQATSTSIQAASMTASIILAVGNFIQVELLTCPCTQKGSLCGCASVKEGAERAGKCVACFGWLIGIMFLAIGLLRLLIYNISPSEAGYGWCLTMLYSWGFNLCINLAMFSFGWWGLPCCGCGLCCKPEHKDGVASSTKYPHGKEYPKGGALRAGDNGACCCEMPDQCEQV